MSEAATTLFAWCKSLLPDLTDIGADFANGVKVIKLLPRLRPDTKSPRPYIENPRFPITIMETRNTALQYAHDLGVQLPKPGDHTIFNDPVAMAELLGCIAARIGGITTSDCCDSAQIQARQRERNSVRRLLRDGDAAVQTATELGDVSEIQAKLRRLAEIRSSVERSPELPEADNLRV
jgi:hypothetical protein